MHIYTLTPQDEHLLPDCLELLERTQGRNVSSLKWLTKSLHSEDGLILVLLSEQKIMGVAGARVLRPPHDYYLPFGLEIVEKMNSCQVGSFSTMGIHEDLQGKGWGQKLAIQREEWLKSKGCNLLVGISWMSGLAHTSNRVFEKRGFKKVRELKDFFVESSVTENLICPVCQNPPCYCPGAMYAKEI